MRGQRVHAEPRNHPDRAGRNDDGGHRYGATDRGRRRHQGGSPAGPDNYTKNGRLKMAFYEEELTRLQEESV